MSFRGGLSRAFKYLSDERMKCLIAKTPALGVLQPQNRQEDVNSEIPGLP